MAASGSGPTPGNPIQPRSLREMIVDQLERAILTGAYRPGQRLVERDLTTQLGVSSIPVREALQELESRGLVTKRHNYGCTVVELEPEDVQRIAEFRRVLEPRVMEWAARRITAEQVEELEARLERLSTAAAASDYPEFVHEDLLFHRRIWEISQNRYAAKALEGAIGSLFVRGMVNAKTGGAIDLSEEARKHGRLLKALKAHDAKLASKTLSGMAREFERQLQPA